MSLRWTPVQKGSILERVDGNREHYSCLIGWLCVVNVHCTLCCHSNYRLYLLFKVEDNCTDTAEALVKFTTQFEER